MTKMAQVSIYGEAKVSESRTSVTIWEEFIVEYKDGNKFERKRKWQVWFNAPVSFETGDWLELKGDLSTKLETYEKEGETKTAVGHSINNPLIVTIKKKNGHVDAPREDLDDLAKYGNAPF